MAGIAVKSTAPPEAPAGAAAGAGAQAGFYAPRGGVIGGPATMRVRAPPQPQHLEQFQEAARRAAADAAAPAWPDCAVSPAAVQALLSGGPGALARCRELGLITALLDHWAALGEAPEEAWWAAVERESRALLRGAPPQQAADLLSAAARAGRRPGAAWLAAAQDELCAAWDRGAGPSLDAWAAALGALVRMGAALDRRFCQRLLAATADQLRSAPPAAAARLLWGVAKARLAPGPAWLAALRGALERAAPELGAHQLAGCLRSLAILGERAGPQEVLGAAGGLLAQELALRPGGAGPGELAQALWALARLGHRPAPGSLCPVDALLPAVLEQLPRLSPPQLSG
ncbi:hypothetical protein MNEG_5628 [Monoraphidium neglectum]|uniref:Uncharacterized protein n=1 Tax=Monoraphidium neglectum TaxID=145388 RepID=A0A0D2MP83_9CHLO|nr:hypothetical protein MNEG_5628 [Monoraphidium neglectum]KIZ02332.1 hypothetical protein MNEG_5628 [Monoraphidium neglectum]|eukprot:XP_013901351.1 hypothetical protein MNEG_5628 [Monoraphidium neglectum]